MKKLDQSQIDFIENNVKKLGSMEAVKRLYKFWREKKCLVDRYAVQYAKQVLPKKTYKLKSTCLTCKKHYKTVEVSKDPGGDSHGYCDDCAPLELEKARRFKRRRTK